MSDIFLNILNRSITASWVVLAVILARFLLRKAPKRYTCALWCVLGARLLYINLPESSLSLIPSVETITPQSMFDREPVITSGVEVIDKVVNPIYTESFRASEFASANPLQIWTAVAANIWLLVMIGIWIWAFVSWLRLRRRVAESVCLRDNIYICDAIDTPFILGMFRPKIYLPSTLTEEQQRHVIAHEEAHIRRFDYYYKPVAYFLLSINWFNPFIWVAYILLCRDIELACDERVIADMNGEEKKSYSTALLDCSVHRHMIAACPLAFGEVGVKERVKAVLHYKKPAFWVVLIAFAVCIALAVCFVTDPESATYSDIIEENGYTVIGQVEIPVTLCIDKAMLPDSIYTSEGHEFEENEVVAYSTETSSIYLYKAVISNESDDLLYFTFNIAHNIPKSGSILSPYKHMGGGSVSPTLDLQSEDLRDINTTYPNALSVRAHGPGNQFAFYVSKEACQAANGTLMIDIVCNQIFYTSEQGDILMAKVLDIEDGYFVVEPVEGSRELSTASRIMVPMENMEPSPEPQIGDILQIEYDGNLMETYPARISKVSKISVISQTVRRMINLDGIIYVDTGDAMPAEIEPSAILGKLHTQVEGRPANHGQGNFDCEGCQYARVDGAYTVLIEGEWYRFTEEVLTSPEYYLTIAEEGAVSIEIKAGSQGQLICKDDLSAYEPGESVLLPLLTGKENLWGVTITVRDAENNEIFSVSISAREHGAADSVIKCGEWIIAPNPLGIHLSVENPTPSGLTLVVNQDGTPWNTIFTGSNYNIARWYEEKGEWALLPQREGTAWTMLAYSVPLNETTRSGINWEWAYGKLEPGRYRIYKSYSGERGMLANRETVEQTYYAEFTIE